MKKLLLGAFFLFLFAWFVMGLAGCMTPERAVRVLKKRGQLPQVCADNFPPNLKPKPGIPIIIRDTQRIPGPAIPCPKDSSKTVKCPDSFIIHDSTHVTDTLPVIDSARIVQLKGVIDGLNHRIANMKADSIKQSVKTERITHGRNNWRSYALWTWGIIAAIIVIVILYYTGKARLSLITGVIKKITNG